MRTYHLLKMTPRLDLLLQGKPSRECYDFEIVETAHTKDDIYVLKGKLKYQNIEAIYHVYTKTECIQMFGKRGYAELIARAA